MILHLDLDVDHRIGLTNNVIADLSDINQCMAFVLHDSNGNLIEQSIRDIAAGRGVR